jgi:hypothetical protein
VAASVLTLFFNNPIQSGSSSGLLDLTQPATSTSTTGWTVGTDVANQYSRMSYNQKLPATNFSALVQPLGTLVGTAGHFAEDAWRLSAATTGNFSAGTWYSSLSVIAVTNASGQSGRARWRLWRSSRVSGGASVELTQGHMIGSVVTNLLTTVAQSSSASTQIGAFSLNNEFLFAQLAWQTTTAATNAGADVLIRLGAISNQAEGSFLATSAFSATAGVGGASGGGAFYQRMQTWMDA